MSAGRVFDNLTVDAVEDLPPSLLRCHLGQTQYIHSKLVDILCNELLVKNKSSMCDGTFQDDLLWINTYLVILMLL